MHMLVCDLHVSALVIRRHVCAWQLGSLNGLPRPSTDRSQDRMGAFDMNGIYGCRLQECDSHVRRLVAAILPGGSRPVAYGPQLSGPLSSSACGCACGPCGAGSPDSARLPCRRHCVSCNDSAAYR